VKEAIARPLIVKEDDRFEGTDALNAWRAVIGERWPLWALRAEAFRRLNRMSAVTYPLSAFVSSICRDEGLARTRSVDGLAALIDRRRVALIAGDPFAWATAELSEEQGVCSRWSYGSAGFPAVLDGPVLASYEPDTEYSSGAYISPYEEIGLELVSLLDARLGARPGTPERASAKRRLAEFLVEVGGPVHGRPTALRQPTARRLADEGFSLFGILWEALGTEVEIHPLALRVIRSLGGVDADPAELSLRLVLPNLSEVEIRSMLQNIRASGRPRSGTVPSAAEFCMHVVAHRLAIPIENVARKMKDGWTAEMLGGSERCAICGDTHLEQFEGDDNLGSQSSA
jgi:hypothetical protein